MMADPLMQTDLPLANKRQGKVRDVYDAPLPDGSDGVLIVATDRISVFDVVLANGIPGKGKLLTQIAKFWFDFFGDAVNHHLVSTRAADVAGLSDAQREALDGRIMLCRKTDVIPVECIVRGYLTGTGWKEYQRTGTVCGIELPPALVNSSEIEQPIFTPSTKPEEGHDENISFERACEIAGRPLMETIRSRSLDIYMGAREYARGRGIIIADTKMEFGLVPGSDDPMLIDELLTPDSSRFWPADDWEPGREQNSFDKQYVRNYTETLVDKGEWDKSYPGPSLPDDVIENTIARYQEAYDRLSGN
ncbi:MAG: phosphoribosylaminoimidazolesuccinocarboxamide synthase [Gammaproteobacteria bacterium]|nr:phosphoribosylaminoimidazolesuccinocarboxamide synthase [Gammaproteobacteria bacterium]